MRVRKIRTIVLVILSVIILIVFRFKRTPNNGNTSTPARRIPVQSVELPRKVERGNPSQGDSSYLMALSYHEQLNTAIKYELFSLAPLGADWGLKLVEPFVVNSRIYGMKDKKIVPISDRDGLQSALPLTSLFDVSDLLMNCSNVQMVPFNIFIRNIPKHITLVYANSNTHPIKEIIFKSSIYNALNLRYQTAGTNIFDCTDVFLSYDRTKFLIKSVETSIEFADRLPKVDRVVCFNPDVPLYTSKFKSYFGTLQDTVVILLNWRGCFIFDCSIKSYNRWLQTGECSCPNGNNNPNKNRYRLITRNALTNYEKCTEQPVPHTQVVIQTANKYLNMLNKSKPLIGIHLRSELLHINFTLKKCHTQGLRTLIWKLLEKHAIESPLEHLLVISDYNQAGSDGCRYERCGYTAGKILRWIYKEWNIRPTMFQPELAGTSPNKGYVSLVEMAMLTNVDYLVLVGHGNFQEQLASHFIAKGNPGSALHRIHYINKSCTI